MTKPQIRWMLASDFAKVALLDEIVSDNPWTESDYHEFLDDKNHVGQVAIVSETVVGVLCCRLQRESLWVSRLFVDPGRFALPALDAMVTAIRNKLNKTRNVAQVLVNETDLWLLEALSEHDFRVPRDAPLVRGHFGERDAVVMQHSLFGNQFNDAAFTNRISEFLGT